MILKSKLLLSFRFIIWFSVMPPWGIASGSEEELMGIDLLDFKIDRVTASGSIWPEGDKILADLGDTLQVSCVWIITDRLPESLRAVISLTSDYAHVGAGFSLGMISGRKAYRLRIGEQIEEKYRFEFRPRYDKVPDLFQDFEVFKLNIRTDRPSWSHSFILEEEERKVLLKRNALSRKAVCLTGNTDIPNQRVTHGLSRIDFPSPKPILHNSAHATSMESELLDGTKTGSRNYNWECVIWSHEKEAQIAVGFLKPVTVEAVVIASPSPYPNRWIGEMVVEAVNEDGFRSKLGTAFNESNKAIRRLHIVVVNTRSENCRSLKIILKPPKTALATEFAVSELYVWGNPSK